MTVSARDARPRRGTTDLHDEEVLMGVRDKFENKAEELRGRAKEAAGAASGDDDLRDEGQADQASSSVKQGVEKAKDKANEIADRLTGGKDE